MERLTDKELLQTNYDPWKICGMRGCCEKGWYDEDGCTKGCHILKMYKKLAEYEDLEEQGKLLKLPCKVGDTVYVLAECANIPSMLDTETGYYCLYQDDCPYDYGYCYRNDYPVETAVFKDTVKSISVEGRDIIIFSEYCAVSGGIGEYIFLTRQEAEVALEKMEDNNDKR